MRLRAAVIGLGTIGMGYDFKRRPTDSRVVATHAQAFSTHPGFDLVSGIDPDPAKRAAFTSKFGAPSYGSLREFFRVSEADVFAIAVPVQAHAPLLRETLAKSPSAVICEKPFGADSRVAAQLVKAARTAGTLLLVNFIRRFEPGSLELRRRIRRGEFGEFRSGTASYSKGLWNNASHMVDLAGFLLGPARAKAVLRSGRLRADHDPEPDFLLEFGRRPLYFLAAREEDYELNELVLNFSRGRLRYGSGGTEIQWTPVHADPASKSCHVLHAKPTRLMTDFSRYQWHAVDALARALKRGETMHESTVGAVATLALLGTVVKLRDEVVHQ